MCLSPESRDALYKGQYGVYKHAGPTEGCQRDITHSLVNIYSGRSVELDVIPFREGRWPIGRLENAEYRPKATKTMNTIGVSDIVPAGTRIVHAKLRHGEGRVLRLALDSFVHCK